MIEGRCPKCGSRYFGWALRFPRNQTCVKCGAALDIFEEGKKVTQGYSPFDAAEHTINPHAETPPPAKEKTENQVQDKK